MNGDGMGGLVVAILFACLGMLVLPALLILWLSQRVAWVKQYRYRSMVGIASFALGLALGFMWLTATFFESTWAPPAKVLLKLPPNFKQPSIILLEQPNAPVQLQWRGYDFPYMAKHTEIDVPASGVVMVASLKGMAGTTFDASTTRGDAINGWASGPGPAALGSVSYIHIELPDASGVNTSSSQQPYDAKTAFATYITERLSADKASPK
jgi:hypothetical protein